LGKILACFSEEGLLLDKHQNIDETSDFWLLYTRRPLKGEERGLLSLVPSIMLIREAAPNQMIVSGGKAPFVSSKQVLELCTDKSLPEIAVHYESEILGLAADKIEELFVQRAELMLKIVETGFARKPAKARYDFLGPTADRVFRSRTAKLLTGDSIHTAISGALSVMESNTMRGVVCAAPTAGSAGIIPGCLYSLKQAGHPMSVIVDTLKVAGVVGAIIGIRATFAAELAGCTVETGAAAAMAAAGLAYVMGALPETVFNAATMPLMNTLGLVCDPIGGSVEVPCYARNIAGVGHAYVSASASIGGFRSFIPFDEVVDTLLKVGKSMPSDLRCTSKGGLAVCPTALKSCK
jgi:L-serine dehydratase